MTCVTFRNTDCNEHRLYLLSCESLRSTQDSQFRDSSLAVGKDQICQAGDACLALCQTLWLVCEQYGDYGQIECTVEAHSLDDLQQQQHPVSRGRKQAGSLPAGSVQKIECKKSRGLCRGLRLRSGL